MARYGANRPMNELTSYSRTVTPRQGVCTRCEAPSTALVAGICWRHDDWQGDRTSPLILERPDDAFQH